MRFSRRERPSVCYSDNGINFVVTNNLLSQLDWIRIKEFSSVQRINWMFNPGFCLVEEIGGFDETTFTKGTRKSFLSYEEFYTVLCDCASVLNSRPLTYVSEDPNDLTTYPKYVFD